MLSGLSWPGIRGCGCTIAADAPSAMLSAKLCSLPGRHVDADHAAPLNLTRRNGLELAEASRAG